jgi:hypothetical protein
MSGCGISSGININCSDLKRVGGVNKRAWLFNISDLLDAKYTIDGSGYVTAINFTTYAGLYAFTGKKKSHSGGYQMIKQQPGGTTFFQHNVLMKLFPDTAAEDLIMENLAVSELGIILETNNEEFFLYGAYNGMEQIDGTQDSGQETATDTSDSLTFQGEEKKKPLRILSTDYATTKALLESYEV